MAKKFEALRNKMSLERQQAVEKRVQKIITEMPLADLRKARQLTQSQIGELLKISQASVSKMEGQTDMYLSTMKRFVEAMGGELEIVAKFPEGPIRINAFSELNENSGDTMKAPG
jgi:predicted XRE-type DNA-binding protein